MSSALLRARILAVSVALLSANSLVISASAATSKDKSVPSGTLMIPLEPRLDDGHAATHSYAPVVKSVPRPARPAAVAAPSAAPVHASQSAAPRRIASKTLPPPSPRVQIHPVRGAALTPTLAPIGTESDTKGNGTDVNTAVPSLAPAGYASTDVEIQTPNDSSDLTVDENSLLQGTVQIVADDTEYDQDKNTFLGTGNAVAVIAGQNSKLEADTILYDQNSQMIDARGNVKIVRDGQLTTGSSFKFRIDSDEYLITNPDTELEGTQVIARTAKGNREGIAFKNGEFTLPQVFHIANNPMAAPISLQERIFESKQHPDAHLPVKPSFKFTARKMVYEKYKEDGNLTVFGGRLKFDKFTVPIPKFTANVGTDSRVVFPVTPIISNNMNVGGINVGPSFNYAVGKRGVFSWAPLVQIGGRSVYDLGTAQQNRGKLGAGVRLAYTNDKLQAHLAYGSVSNLVVGDFKYRWNKNTSFQSGINRFLNDGIMGMRRARLAAEVVDTRNITTIPGIAILQFRQSAGLFQDQPQLVQLQGSQYSDLFNTTGYSKKAGFRLQEQIMAMSHPLFAVGNDKWGVKMSTYAGLSLRGYSTGDAMAMGQFGPILTVRANRMRFQGGYTQSGVTGKSPFVFDQFIQGQRSVFLSGDVRVNKWLTLGTNLGYNMSNSMLYSRGFSAAIGPDDFKFLITRDTISGINRVGFTMVSGSPVKFDKLIMKGVADQGQLGGI